MSDDFRDRFLNKATNAEEFFKLYEEDIFQSEYRLLIQKLPKKEADGIVEEIKGFEEQMLKSCNVNTDNRLTYLFHTKDVVAASKMKSLTQDIYASLTRWAKENLSGLKNIASDRQMDRFLDFFDPVRKSGLQLSSM